LHLVGRFDVREFLERTCQHDFRRYVLLDVAPAQTMLEALLEDFGAGAIVPTHVAVFELADGETAVYVAEPFGGLASDAPWRSASPRLAALADRTSSQLAHALDRLDEVASHRHTAATEAFVM